MTLVGWIQILVFAAVILAVTRPLGAYLYRVYEGERQPLPRLLGPVERGLYRLCGVDPRREQTWVEYAFALLAFGWGAGILLYILMAIILPPATTPAGWSRSPRPTSILPVRHPDRRTPSSTTPPSGWPASPSCPTGTTPSAGSSPPS